jgi:hypothetical protein
MFNLKWGPAEGTLPDQPENSWCFHGPRDEENVSRGLELSLSVTRYLIWYESASQCRSECFSKRYPPNRHPI